MVSFEMCLVALVMPLKAVSFTVHNYLTKRDYSYSIDDICDFGILVCVIVWFYTFIEWSTLPKDEGSESYVITSADVYTYFTITKTLAGEFELMIFLSVMVMLIWGRFLLMLQLTKSFGPMLRIILNMFGDVFKFLFIWSVVIICLASVASLLFGELPEFTTFTDVFLNIFGTSQGNYDMTVFDTLEIGPYIG